MNVDELCSARVEARAHWNDTGIDLNQSHVYLLQATGEWLDSKIRANPDGYSSTNIVLRLAERWRRQPDARWFALVGSIGASRDSQFLIGCNREYKPLKDGRLYCFANDVQIAYFNNSGHVQLTVRRIA
jgi:hypothetical protein